MKRFLSLGLALLSTSTITSLLPLKKAIANTFNEQQLNQEQLIAIAVPFGYKNYSLAIIEQIPNQKQCWQEYGTAPVAVDPLLLNFDFTGSCNRATDSNGYSIRIDGNDFSDYRLELIERNGELHLIAVNLNPNKPRFFVGKTGGTLADKTLIKVFLNPGWQITKRVYQGQTLGHFYLSSNSQILSQNGLIEHRNQPDNPQVQLKKQGFSGSINGY